MDCRGCSEGEAAEGGTTKSEKEMDRMFNNAFQRGDLHVALNTPFMRKADGQSKKMELPIYHYYRETTVDWTDCTAWRPANTSSEVVPSCA